MTAALVIAGGQIGDKKAKSKTGSSAKSADPDMQRLTQEIADLIGLSTEFKLKGKGGELRIRFSQFDELDSLLKKLGIES
jgi:ParB family chromosome partitioning protein